MTRTILSMLILISCVGSAAFKLRVAKDRATQFAARIWFGGSERM